MSMETFRRAIAWTPAGFEIRFSGFSEPYMNPLCTAMILYAHEQKRNIGLFTTLIGASMDDIEAVMSVLSFRQNKDSLIIHLPSDDKTEHFIVNDSYLKMLRYVLSAKGDNIDIHYHGRDLRKEVKKVVLESKRKAFFIKLINRSGNVKLSDEPPPKRLHGSIRCTRLGMHEHVILPDGRVTLCCNDFGLKHVLGNIYKDDYASIKSGKEMKKIFQGQDDESIDILCRRCQFAVKKEVLEAASKAPYSLINKRKHLKLWKILQKKKQDLYLKEKPQP